MTETPERPACPECAPGAANPHDEPERLHVHLTGYGYLIYAPEHQRPDFIEDIRAAARQAGREDAARAVELAAAGVIGVMVNRMFAVAIGKIARGDA